MIELTMVNAATYERSPFLVNPASVQYVFTHKVYIQEKDKEGKGIYLEPAARIEPGRAYKGSYQYFVAIQFSAKTEDYDGFILVAETYQIVKDMLNDSNS